MPRNRRGWGGTAGRGCSYKPSAHGDCDPLVMRNDISNSSKIRMIKIKIQIIIAIDSDNSGHTMIVHYCTDSTVLMTWWMIFNLALPTSVDCDVSGTALGDPIEVGAQEKIYGKDRCRPLSFQVLSG